MEKSTQKKIIRQIEKLCEKQYRKGFQQGFHASENNELSKKQVDEFRNKGIIQNYSKIVHPHSGRKEDAKERLIWEMAMPGMEELKHFFYE